MVPENLAGWFRKTCMLVPENLRVGSIQEDLGSVPENSRVGSRNLRDGSPKTWGWFLKTWSGGNLALCLPLALAVRLWQGERPGGPLVGWG